MIVAFLCALCGRPTQGLGWSDQSSRPRIFAYFCGRACQQQHDRIRRQKQWVNQPALEQAARTAVIPALANYVMTIGVEKGLAAYSRPEIERLIQIVVEHYQQARQQAYHTEVCD